MLQTGQRLNFVDDLNQIYVEAEDTFISLDKSQNWKIIDKDGDGVADNEKLSHHELDKFVKPFVYGDVEEMHNTRNGELPGHHRHGDHLEPKGHAADLVRDEKEAKTAQQVVDDMV
jgi:hypothetical protein